MHHLKRKEHQILVHTIGIAGCNFVEDFSPPSNPINSFASPAKKPDNYQKPKSLLFIHNMAHKALVPLALLSLLLSALLPTSHAGSLAVYWGQNKDEGSLADACNSGNYNYVIIGFLATFGNNQTPLINLAGHCDPNTNECTSFSGDIKNCQNQGIKVLLSIGGGAGSYYLSSADDARQVHDLVIYLYNYYSSCLKFG